ncbi:hypothetical protein J6590_102366 [Homalodisca vitripennis]|nr:hypothetical protein J6590_102366 [Homalodisca vitripennis]
MLHKKDVCNISISTHFNTAQDGRCDVPLDKGRPSGGVYGLIFSPRFSLRLNGVNGLYSPDTWGDPVKPQRDNPATRVGDGRERSTTCVHKSSAPKPLSVSALLIFLVHVKHRNAGPALAQFLLVRQIYKTPFWKAEFLGPPPIFCSRSPVLSSACPPPFGCKGRLKIL